MTENRPERERSGPYSRLSDDELAERERLSAERLAQFEFEDLTTRDLLPADLPQLPYDRSVLTEQDDVPLFLPGDWTE